MRSILAIFFFYTLLSCGGLSGTLKKNDLGAVKLMSYNIRIASPPSLGWGNTELDSIARVIKESRPDLVALQEVDAFTNRSGLDSHQARELGEKTGMHYHFTKAVDRSGGDYGVAILSAFPIKEATSYQLPVREGSSGETRGLGFILVELPSGQELVFGSVHLDHLSNEDRAFQLNQVIEHSKKWRDKPLIIGADLNMTPDNEVMKLVKQHFFIGCDSCPLTFPQDKPNRTIDYILLNNTANELFNITEYKTIEEKYASDHLPVTAILSKKP